MLYNTLQANKKLELQAREQENLTHYMAQLENHYQDIRRFKHDYLNILSTITGYIQENDMDKLRNYFDSSIVTSSSILVNQDDTLARLSLIKVTEIKGLLYTKMVQAMNQSAGCFLRADAGNHRTFHRFSHSFQSAGYFSG